MDENEKPKKSPSLGVVIPPKRKDITVVTQGGLLPGEDVDGTRANRSDVSSQIGSDVIAEGNVDGFSDEVSGQDVSDGRSSDKDQNVNQDVGAEEVSNEENITQK